jgi:hypothetical protein
MNTKDGLNEDGGCAVDWSWLEGEEIAEVRSSLDTITFRFRSGLTFAVQARLWKGAPFVAFDPPPPAMRWRSFEFVPIARAPTDSN